MSVFQRITIDAFYSVATQQRVLIAWALSADFVDRGPYTFTLQRSLSATDTSNEWEDIATCVDQAWIYDTRPLTVIVSASVYYRIKLVTPDGTYTSQVQGTEAYWSAYDWSIAREIIRKESMLLQRRTGAKGWLFKRRSFGTTCAVCTDPITKQVLRSNCETCYNTGVTGGYYAQLEYWLSFDASHRMRKLDKDVGVQTQVIEQARGLAYPLIDGMDVWVQSGTNKRFFIQKDITYIAKLRGIPLVATLVLEQIPSSHVLYTLPVTYA